jgi:hypothetical protein
MAPSSVESDINRLKILKIVGFLDFVHHPEFYYKKTQRLANCIYSLPQVGRETPTLLGPLKTANLNQWTTLT